MPASPTADRTVTVGADGLPALTPALASRVAALALGHVTREYPNKLDHVLAGPEDARGPRALHPVFYGSFDWHSCVHGYWLLARVLRRVPSLPEAAAIRALFAAHLTPERVAGEVAYLMRPTARGFERPYGWAWLLALAAEVERHATPDGRTWAAALRPLAAAFSERFREFLPKADYPIRAGTHFNTAFAVALALEYADAAASVDVHGDVPHAPPTPARDPALGTLLRDRARRWYAADRDCQAWEPGGDDFLSPALVEAACMRRALPPAEFAAWFDRFLPHVADGEPATLFAPVAVSDRTDGKIAHLDGLNLSRAWCWRAIATALEAAMGPGDPRLAAAREAAQRHLAAGMPHVAGDYMGEHWLATFALLALDGT